MLLRPALILIFCLVANFFNNIECRAQTGNHFFELSGGIGKIISNHPEFPTVNHAAYIGTFKYSTHWNGYKPWHRYYHFPVVSVNLTGGNIGNDKILGSFAGIMADFSFEKKLSKSIFWAPRICIGTAYFTKPYNEFSNPENVVVGSKFTFLVSAEAALGYRVSTSTDLLFKLSLLHASNSHYKLPNVGMNLPVFSLGARYRLKGVEEKPDSSTTSYNKKIQFHLKASLGVNEMGSSTSPVNGPKYKVYLLSAYFARLYSPVNKVSAGIEAWYSEGVYDFIVSQEFYDSHYRAKSTSVALKFGHEFLMGHFGLVTDIGLYLYNPFYKERLKRNDINGLKDHLKSYIPARLGFQYYLKNTYTEQNRNLFVGLYIKSNFGQADFLESSLGYMF